MSEKRIKQDFFKAAKIIISVALIAILLHKIDVPKFLEDIGRVPFLIFAGAFLLYMVSIFLNAWKWKQFVIDLPLKALISATFKAQFYSTVLPGQMFGEASKVVSLHGMNSGSIELTTSVLADKVLSLINVLIVGIVGGWMTDLPFGKSLCMVYAIACIFLCVILFVPRIKKIDVFLGSIPNNNFTILKRIYCAWRTYANRKGRLMLAFWIGLFSQLLGAVEIAWIAQSLGIHIAFVDYMWMITSMSFLLLLPISFGGIGVREVSLVGMLGLFSVSNDKALMISLVIFSAQIASAMIGGMLVLADSMKEMKQQ